MGFDVKIFEYLLKVGFARHWNAGTISCEDVWSRGLPRRERRSLGANGGLGLVYITYALVFYSRLFF
jgi:hypothetical protein